MGTLVKRLEGWKVGRLEGWKVGMLEGWKVQGDLSFPLFPDTSTTIPTLPKSCKASKEGWCCESPGGCSVHRISGTTRARCQDCSQGEDYRVFWEKGDELGIQIMVWSILIDSKTIVSVASAASPQRRRWEFFMRQSSLDFSVPGTM